MQVVFFNMWNICRGDMNTDLSGKPSEESGLSIVRALNWRYAIALALVALLSTAAWFSLHLVISEQQSTAAIVNVSGRQRMLSQRTALFSNLLVNSPKSERSIIRGKLKESIELMALSHQGLTQGDDRQGLPDSMSPQVRAMYFEGPNSLDLQVVSYIKAVNELLQQRDDRLTPQNNLLRQITGTASSTLVAGLDKMARQYQLEGEASVRSLENAETVFWLATLLLLLLEATLIFRPFINHMKIVVGKLQQVTDELRLHEAQLEEMIRQRTADLESKTLDLSESEEKFRMISTAAQDAIAIIDMNERVVYWNPAAEKIFGYVAHEAMGKNLHDLLVPASHRDIAHSAFKNFQNTGEGKLVGKTFEINALRKDGAEIPVELSISAFWMKSVRHALGMVRDITERKHLEIELKRQAHIDYLTGLSNRGHFMEQAELELSRAARYGKALSLFMLDIDFFKQINDTHGHKAGDQVLMKLAEVCRETLREIDVIGRVGGEEFAIILPETDINAAMEVAERLRAALAAAKVPLQNGLPITFTVSIGVASLASAEDNMDVLLSQADKALYEAKAAGRNKICAAK